MCDEIESVIELPPQLPAPLPKHNTTQWDGPKYQHYSIQYARIQSYFTWPADSKQKAENLSKARFFYTVKVLRYQKPIYCRKINFL